MSGFDDQIKRLREKLPEGSAFRVAIERATGLWTEITRGEDPDYKPGEIDPGLTENNEPPPAGEKRSAAETNPALFRETPEDHSPRRI